MTVYLKERQWQHRWKIHKRSTLGVTTWKKALWRSHPATSTLCTRNGFLKEKTSHPEERKVTGETGAFRKGCKLSENIHPLEEYGLFSCITLQLTQTAVRLLLSIQPLFKLCLFPLWPPAVSLLFTLSSSKLCRQTYEASAKLRACYSNGTLQEIIFVLFMP